jgi:hypothetical protein
MGQPASGHAEASRAIGAGGAPGELKHLSTPRKRKHRDSVSSGERTRTSPNRAGSVAGRPKPARGCTPPVGTAAAVPGSEQGRGKPKRLERRARGGESPVGGLHGPPWRGDVSTAGHEEPRGKRGRPRSKAQYPLRPIAHEYREGRVKSTPARGVKEFLNPFASRRPEPEAPSAAGSSLDPRWRRGRG